MKIHVILRQLARKATGTLEGFTYMLKHYELIHRVAGEPHFNLKPVKFHTLALARQLYEAVRIRRRIPQI